MIQPIRQTHILFLIIIIIVALIGCQPTAPSSPTASPTTAATATTNISLTHTSTAIAPPPSTPTPTQTAVATATHTPIPSPTASPTAVATAPPPSIPSNTTETLAYVQNNQLIIYNPNYADTPLVADHCLDQVSEENSCTFNHLKWSPNGRYLLYHTAQTVSGQTVEAYRLVNDQGQQQQTIVSTDIFNMKPATWSPDGSQIAYLLNTGLREIDEEFEPFEPEHIRNIHTLYTSSITAEGTLNPSQEIGRIDLTGQGCGGGGRSTSDNLYESEGGTAYSYFPSMLLEWSAADILIYSRDTCESFGGYGRFDLTTTTALDPYPRGFYSLTLSPAGDQWSAILGHPYRLDEPRQLITGTPASSEYTILETAAPPELLFYGRETTLYYTSRTPLTEWQDLSSQIANPFEFGISPYFTFYHTQLWQFRPATQPDQLIYEADDHSYARVTELSDGSLAFIRIENDTALATAITENQLTADNVNQYRPIKRFVTFTPGLENAGQLTTILENAGQLAIAPQ